MYLLICKVCRKEIGRIDNPTGFTSHDMLTCNECQPIHTAEAVLTDAGKKLLRDEKERIIKMLETKFKGKKYWVIDPTSMTEAEIKDTFEQAELHHRLAILKKLNLDTSEEQRN